MGSVNSSAAQPQVGPEVAWSPRRKRFKLDLPHIPLLILLFTALAPLYILIINSLKSDLEIKAHPFSLPTALHWENFTHAWQVAHYSVAFRNSIIVCALTIFVVCLFGGLAAYGMVRLPVPGNQIMTVYYLVGITVPALLYLVPLFVIWTRLHLTNNVLGMVPIYAATHLPFSIFLLRSYFIGLPVEIEEAARMDGCSDWGVFGKIVVPLSWPAFASVGLIVGIWTWNEFLFAMTFLQEDATRTVTAQYSRFTGQYVTNYADIAAAGLIMILPAMILFLLLQRRFIQGMAAGSLKA